MKKFIVLLMAGMLMIGLSGNGFAEVATYTFEGTVTNITDANSILTGQIKGGDPVEFTLECDFDADGFYTRYDGTIIPRGDYSIAEEDVDRFWCDYISGSDIGPIGEITIPNPVYTEENNYGQSRIDLTSGRHFGNMYGGSAYNGIWVISYTRLVQDWDEGFTGYPDLTFQHQVRNQAGQSANISGLLTVVSISGTQPPEPPEAAQEIIDDVLEIVALDENESTKLTKTLDEAINLINEGDNTTAIDKLNKFIRKTLNIIEDGNWDETDEDLLLELIDAAMAIIDQLLAP